MLFGVGGQLNFFRTLFLETNLFMSDGIGVHGFADFLWRILHSILGRSMNLRIGPESSILIRLSQMVIITMKVTNWDQQHGQH